MARMKQLGKKNSAGKAAAAATLGVAGLAAGFGLSLGTGSAFASTLPAADVPQAGHGLPETGQRFVLGEEEMADVSLATFHIFDKENDGAAAGQQIAWVGRCGGCRGCGVRGCRCGGCRGCGGCCRRWGHCRWC
jgi:hypothetical protein